jgi:hypothetical protein
MQSAEPGNEGTKTQTEARPIDSVSTDSLLPLCLRAFVVSRSHRQT